MTKKQILESGKYLLHHTALKRGYVSVKIAGIVKPYKGRYGKGYTVECHNPKSTQYCYVTYYIERG